ncbi:protein FAM200C-like [Tigriopus californicus]|uniref:protein FAM200C-like n=1 Tax=Tigriopus californicus TaxID=6832 RepID=UPI0027D9EC39|nr:protein FAM200C-like [Tigriopus californicus]
MPSSQSRDHPKPRPTVGFGFTCLTERDGIDRPQCMLCNLVMSNGNLKPSGLKEHLESKHKDHVGTSIEAFKLKRVRYDQKATLSSYGFSAPRKPLLEASYKVSYMIAREKKPHTIGETLVKPCALEMAKIVLGEDAAKKLSQVSVSNDTVHQRIKDMSQNIITQVVSEIKQSPAKISMQIDESTDVSNHSQLLVFVRYVHEKNIKEEFLFCERLETTTKAVDVFKLIQSFFDRHELAWDLIGSICTDGAPALIGKISGFVAIVKEKAPHVLTTHCVLHRQALASKTLPKILKEAMGIVVQTVNFIRGRALNQRLFKKFCDEIGAEHGVLLYHTEVRWLSRGSVLTRVVELQDEILEFLKHQQSPLAKHFEDEHFIVSLGYLADIFSLLNDLNTSMQGRDVDIIQARGKVVAFTRKLPIWCRRVESGNLANFPNLDNILTKDDTNDLCMESVWIQNPFSFDVSRLSDNDLAKDDFIEFQEDPRKKADFERAGMDVKQFWCEQISAYPSLAMRAMNVLVPFTTTYLCEIGFSALLNMKSKWRNRLDVSDDMRVALSATVPRFDVLIA